METSVADAQRGDVAGTHRDELRRAILLTLVYADLFDYPLTSAEICRYLIRSPAPAASVEEMLDGDATLRTSVERTGEWFHLRGRSGLAELRRRRAEASERLWPTARRYASAIAHLPLVRGVAVTGALSMCNADPGDDIDLFILARPGRLWLCRLLVLGVVKLAALRGHRICPNFLLSTDEMTLYRQNLFTAHEVAQLTPVRPSRWLADFRHANHWACEYLPKALDGAGAVIWTEPILARIMSAVLAWRIFDPVERWEMDRKIRRLTARAEAEGGSVAFSEHECRGHFAAHDARILAAFAARAAALEEAGS